MDILGALSQLLGGGKKPVERKVTPGYEEQARRYEAAFDRGDYDSPDIIGQDPKNFGYPEDKAVQQPRYNFSVPLTQRLGGFGAVRPGYEQQARHYNDAINRGDYSSTAARQDPVNFGYPTDDGDFVSRLRNLTRLR